MKLPNRITTTLEAPPGEYQRSLYLSLVRPIRGQACRKGGYYHYVLLSGARKKFLKTSGSRYVLGLFWAVWSVLELLYGFLRALFSLQINPIMNVIMMIPTKTIAPKIIHKHHLWGCYPRPLPAGDNLHHGDCRSIYEGGAMTTANFCCQMTMEQVDKVQLAQNMYQCWSKQSVIDIANLSRASNENSAGASPSSYISCR